MAFDYTTLITDRTAADVRQAASLEQKITAGTASAAERVAFGQPLRGKYNATDLNRVNEAVTDLSATLAAYGHGAALTPKTDWAEDDVPTPAQLEAYLASVEALRDALGSTAPLPEDMDALDYEGANRIERALKSVHEMIDGMTAAFTICGTTVSGY